MTPPANAVVFSADEKSQIQALQRARARSVPIDLGQPERRTHNYVRHGTLDVFAALNVAGPGEVLTRCTAQHRAQDLVVRASTFFLSRPPTPLKRQAKELLHNEAAIPRAAPERIDAGRAARGNPAREERDANHEHRHERCQAEGPHRRLVSAHRGDHARATNPEREPEAQADETQAQTATHEQSDDLTTLGAAERHANADLTDALPHRERDHGVEADGREQERERARTSGRDGGDHGTRSDASAAASVRAATIGSAGASLAAAARMVGSRCSARPCVRTSR